MALPADPLFPAFQLELIRERIRKCDREMPEHPTIDQTVQGLMTCIEDIGLILARKD